MANYPAYEGEQYKITTKAAKSAVMKRAGQLRKYMEPRSAMNRAWKDVIAR